MPVQSRSYLATDMLLSTLRLQRYVPRRVAAQMLAITLVAASAISSAGAQSSEMIPRNLLVDMARSQYDVLCGSDAFKQCMGFTDSACTNLASTAIEQCLMSLPEQISPEALDNSALESCPQSVFEDAGFTEEKAGRCFDEAMQADG